MRTNHSKTAARGRTLAAATAILISLLPAVRSANGGSNYVNGNICGWTGAGFGNYINNGIRNASMISTIDVHCPIPQDREDMDDIVFRVRGLDADTGGIPIICTGQQRDSAGNIVATTIDGQGPLGTYTGPVTIQLAFQPIVNNGTNHQSYSVFCTLPPRAELHNLRVIPRAEYQD